MNPWAVRFEPGYKYFVNPVDFAHRSFISVDTERTLQATSYGLMQVMGGVCREHGYVDDLIKLPSHPEIALTLAVKHLKQKIERYGLFEAISAYNAGSPRKTPGGMYINQVYVDKVHSELLALSSPIAYMR